MHREAAGAGLHLREENEGAQGGKLLPGDGLPQRALPWKDENGNYQFYGRFNQGVVTLNLVDIALSSGGNMEKFWKIFDERLDLCYRALMCRHNRLKGHPVGRSTDPVAVRSLRPFEKRASLSISCWWAATPPFLWDTPACANVSAI